jgi:hypothetical protein
MADLFMLKALKINLQRTQDNRTKFKPFLPLGVLITFTTRCRMFKETILQLSRMQACQDVDLRTLRKLHMIHTIQLTKVDIRHPSFSVFFPPDLVSRAFSLLTVHSELFGRKGGLSMKNARICGR